MKAPTKAEAVTVAVDPALSAIRDVRGFGRDLQRIALDLSNAGADRISRTVLRAALAALSYVPPKGPQA